MDLGSLVSETVTEAVSAAKNNPSGSVLVTSISVFVAVLCVCIVVGHLLEENRWVNESITAILIVFHLSGILTVFFCGIVMSHYAWHNVVIWWAGLMRGAVSIALAFTQVFGFLTKPLVDIVIHRGALGSISRVESKDDFNLPLLSNDANKSSLTLLMERPVHTIHAYWRKFDDTYMRPVFGGPRGAVIPTL
ncbi:Sodium/hydrogen exchanger 4 [Acorus calamus]|uniref:Sodium/hydrogen exchanger 4 n=1 Tax=Acorus calamus TaxID=4465 RepID=A0AAV9DVW7_ACOCL|nr:Sodium/hydrogen exchanger 4 [Acorus calamus]